MDKEILTFGNIEIEKNKFYHNKTPIFLKDVDIEKVLVSNKISFGKKNYKYLLVMIITAIKTDNNLYNDNNSANIKKEFDSELVYNKEYLNK